MTHIEIKSLQHVEKIAEEIDTHQVYKSLYEKLKDEKIDEQVILRITNAYDLSMQKNIKKPLQEIKDWLKVINSNC